jgi:GT2 family glycosyltransferase
MRVAVLITCFNRRETTLQCLEGLKTQKLPDDLTLETVLVDDRSKDGTADAVRERFPETRVLVGDGSLFWCGGMRKAWSEAALSDPEYYLLLNDDTQLDSSAISVLLEMVGAPDSAVIAVAAIRDPQTGIATYGGIRRESGLVAPTGQPEICDSFNANAVLVPRGVYKRLGGFHDVYTHGMGDFDYGFTATRQGIKVIQSGNFLGECGRNALTGSWRDRTLSRAERWRLLNSPKGLPFREWMEFNRRNSGWLWPLRTITPTIRVMLGL